MSSLEIQALGNQSLPTVIEEVALGRWSSAVALTILIYDTLLTLDDEVQFIWSKRWSAIKILTQLNRIITLISILLNAQHLAAVRRSFSNEYCEVVLIGTGCAAFVSFAMCNWILLARTKALFGDSRIINYALVIYFLCAYSVTAVLVVLSSSHLVGQIFYSPTIHVCGIATRPHTMGFIWVSPMIFETTIFLLTIYKLYEKATVFDGGSNLLLVLYRDGVSYYIVIICLRVFNLVAWMFMPTPFIFIGVFLLWAIMTIAVTRLQINLVKAIDPTQPTSLSNMHLPGLRKGMATLKSHTNTQNTHVSRRFSSHIQLRSFKESRQPTHIEIETSVQTIIVPDDQWHNIRTNSAQSHNPIEVTFGNAPSTDAQHTVRSSDLESSEVWTGGYAV